jgi:hypothetical protein
LALHWNPGRYCCLPGVPAKSRLLNRACFFGGGEIRIKNKFFLYYLVYNPGKSCCKQLSVSHVLSGDLYLLKMRIPVCAIFKVKIKFFDPLSAGNLIFRDARNCIMRPVNLKALSRRFYLNEEIFSRIFPEKIPGKTVPVAA